MNAAQGPEEQAPPSVTFASGGLSWMRVRTPRVLSTIAKVLYGVSALGAISAAWNNDWFAGFYLISLLAWPLWILSYILSLSQFSSAGGIAVSRTELVVHGSGSKRTFIPLSRVAGALVVEREVFGNLVRTVEIELTNGDTLTARFPDPTSAHAVVKALGFGPGGKRLHVRLAKPTRRLMHPVLGFVAYGVGMLVMVGPLSVGLRGPSFGVGFALYPLVVLAAYAGLQRLFRAPEVIVGDDGLVVRARKRTFVPRSDIVGVAGAGAALVLDRRSRGRTLVTGAALDPARAAAVAKAVDERLRASTTAPDRLAHYERGGRGLAEWRAHLARGMNDASYRHNAATVDEAAAVLHSAEATPEQRVGAALALRIAGEPKERVRIAVDASADDGMREALAAVAEADDAGESDPRLEKALRRLPTP